MPVESQPLFPNYMQEKRWLPVWFWHLLRLGSLALSAAFIWLCWHHGELALSVFWGVAVPVLPLVFWLTPGLWRNLCPLAATNQLPRLFRCSFKLSLPEGLKRYAGVIGILILFIAVPLRLILLNQDAYALSLLILITLGAALLGGIIFKGKSGWCGSFCPLLPVQRLYGQTPAKVLPNSHCQPCVGCTRNCYDFNPQVAYLADLYDKDPVYAGDRKFFAGAMPGLILAYFTLPNVDQLLWWEVYLQFGFYCLVGVGSFYVIETFVKVGSHKITAVFAMLSLNLFYWFVLEIIFTNAQNLSHLLEYQWTYPDWLTGSLRTALLLLSLQWLLRTLRKEPLFLSQAFTAQPTRMPSSAPLQQHIARQSDNPVVTIEPSGAQLVVRPDMTLLELLEANGEKINSGCRMGACGADPVGIVQGEENLSDMGEQEQSTLERLGFYQGARMACCVQVHGDVRIELAPEAGDSQSALKAEFKLDDSVNKIVIIGNGIAGVTAADTIRRFHKSCEIHVIGREKYPLYNRMAISKLIYGHSGMQGLMLLPEDWYQKRQIECWLNTRVRNIDIASKSVSLATGEKIHYDRLIITTGSEAHVPHIELFDLAGCYVLRSADDAMSLRDFIQRHDCRQAVIAGGGLLGLEAAYALHQMNMKVTVLERSAHLLKRQLDAGAAKILHNYLQALGLNILYNQQLQAVKSTAQTTIQDSPEDEAPQLRLDQVVLAQGKEIKTDILLVAAGIEPNTRLAKKAGLDQAKGIVVNASMQTSQAGIYAAGDIAQLQGAGGVSGLWTVAVEQGRVAGMNAIGASEIFESQPVPIMLKVVGVELTSIGQFNLDGDGQDKNNKDKNNKDKTTRVEAIIFSEDSSYRKLVIKQNKIVGAILLGYPQYAQAVNTAIVQQQDICNELAALRQGDWRVFES